MPWIKQFTNNYYSCPSKEYQDILPDNCSSLSILKIYSWKIWSDNIFFLEKKKNSLALRVILRKIKIPHIFECRVRALSWQRKSVNLEKKICLIFQELSLRSLICFTLNTNTPMLLVLTEQNFAIFVSFAFHYRFTGLPFSRNSHEYHSHWKYNYVKLFCQISSSECYTTIVWMPCDCFITYCVWVKESFFCL